MKQIKYKIEDYVLLGYNISYPMIIQITNIDNPFIHFKVVYTNIYRTPSDTMSINSFYYDQGIILDNIETAKLLYF